MAECVMPVGFMTKTYKNLFGFMWGNPYPWSKETLCVTGCDIGDHYIALSKEDNEGIIKPFIKREQRVQSEEDNTKLENGSFEWKLLTDRLPAGAIPCYKNEEFGNMYVGKHATAGVGMVVSREINKWYYYTHENTKAVTRDVYVLCNVKTGE